MTENTAPSFNRLQVTEPEEMTWANDLLNRKEYADRLTTLIKNTKGPYVIGLTSPWGSGKTFFLQAWRHQLLEEKKPCIYFNAWEMDASGDPLINLMAVIQDQAQSHFFLSPLINWFKKATWLPSLINGAGGITKVLLNKTSGSLLEASANIVKSAQSYLRSAKNFKKDLEKTAEELSGQSEGFPLFIMVDELDRCRPSYAIELLERIKHLFNVPHVVFLLAIDSTQLLQHVEHTFGLKPHEENGDIIQDPRRDYLGKFFDIYYNLPPVENRKFVQMLLSKDIRLDEYSKIFKNDTKIDLPFPLCNILSSDENLFADKSLRRLAQDVEYFSLFIRSYDNLEIEYVIFSFLTIFSSESRLCINKKIFNNFENYIKNILNNMDIRQIILSRKFIIKYPEFGIAEYCAYIFLILCMIKNIEEKIYNFALHLSVGYHDGQGITATGTGWLLDLKKATDIADDVYNRLQFLKDFHPVPQEENTSQER